MLAAMEAGDDYGVFYIGKTGPHKHTRSRFMRIVLSALEEHELAERFFGEFIAEIYDFLGGIKRRQDAGVFREIDPRIVVRFSGMLIHHSRITFCGTRNAISST